MASDPEFNFEAVFQNAAQHAERISTPINQLSWSILNAALHCRDSVKQTIKLMPGRAPLEQEAYVFYEYLYLFIDLAIREAIGSLTPAMFKETQKYVTHMISLVAVGTYFEHWSEERKKRIREQFVVALNERAEEFAENLRNAHNELEVLDNFVMTANEVCRLAGQEENWPHMKEPMLATISQEWVAADFANDLANIFAAYAA